MQCGGLRILMLAFYNKTKYNGVTMTKLEEMQCLIVPVKAVASTTQ